MFIFDILEIDKLRGGYLVDYYGFFYWIVVDDFDFEVFFCVVRFYIVIYGFYEVVVVVFKCYVGWVKLLFFLKSGFFF